MSLDVLFQRADIWRGGQTPSVIRSGVPTGFAALDVLLPGGGWPRGALTEIVVAEGHGALSLLMPALARLREDDRWIAFVAPPYLPYPPALAARGINLARVLCVSLGNEAIESPIVSSLRRHARAACPVPRYGGGPPVEDHCHWVPACAGTMTLTKGPLTPALPDQLWALEQCLCSGACAAVLSWFAQPPVQHLRRLHLAAEHGNSLAWLFYPPDAAAHTTPAALRLGVSPQALGLSVHILKRRGGWPCGPVCISAT
ncbi:MAG: hypothetical protein ACT4NU_03640 [Chromatiales bacterium]